MFKEVVNAFVFPFSDKKWPLKLFVGGVFSLSTFFLSGVLWMGKIGLIIGLVLIAALVFPMGFMFKILKDALDGKKGVLPEWSELEACVKDGFIVFCIFLVYSVIFYLISGLLVLAMASSQVLYPLLSLLNIVIAALILVVPNIIMISICIYAQKGTLKAVLDFGGIFAELKKNVGDYIVLVLIILGAKMLILLLQGYHVMRFGVFPLVTLLIPFFSFYLLIVVARLYGSFFKKK